MHNQSLFFPISLKCFMRKRGRILGFRSCDQDAGQNDENLENQEENYSASSNHSVSPSTSDNEEEGLLSSSDQAGKASSRSYIRVQQTLISSPIAALSRPALHETEGVGQDDEQYKHISNDNASEQDAPCPSEGFSGYTPSYESRGFELETGDLADHVSPWIGHARRAIDQSFENKQIEECAVGRGNEKRRWRVDNTHCPWQKKKK